MSMFKHTMSNKSEAHRKRVALLLSGGATLFIFAVWAVALPARLANLSGNNSSASAASPIDAIAKNVNDSVSSLKNNINAGFTEPLPSNNANQTQNISNGVVISDTSAASTTDNGWSY